MGWVRPRDVGRPSNRRAVRCAPPRTVRCPAPLDCGRLIERAATMRRDMTALVRRIDQVATAELDDVGGKGANLGELAHASFPVPEGFILTTTAYTLAARAAGLDPTEPVAAARRLTTSAVPDAVAAATRSAYAALGGGRVAGRSPAAAGGAPHPCVA